jgi:hypothetical protein
VGNAHKFTSAATRLAVKAAFAFPRTCNVEQVAETTDGQGGQTEGWSTLYTSVPCLLVPLGMREEVEAGRVRSYSAYRVRTPALKTDGTFIAITGKHRLVVAASSPYPAMTLLIDGAPTVAGINYEIDAKHYN